MHQTSNIRLQASFEELADRIQSALDNGDAVQFSDLVNKRSRMIHNLVESDDKSQLPSELLRKLTEENRKWLTNAQQFLKKTQAKIEKIKPLKSATRQLSNAYSDRTAEPGSLLSRQV